MAGDGGGAKIWIIDNQVGRRNITEWVKFELSLKKKDILLKQGREKQKESGKLYGENHQKQEVLSIIDKTSEEEPHNTRNIISSEIGKSTGWVAMAEVVAKKAPEEIAVLILLLFRWWIRWRAGVNFSGGGSSFF